MNDLRSAEALCCRRSNRHRRASRCVVWCVCSRGGRGASAAAASALLEHAACSMPPYRRRWRRLGRSRGAGVAASRARSREVALCAAHGLTAATPPPWSRCAVGAQRAARDAAAVEERTHPHRSGSRALAVRAAESTGRRRSSRARRRLSSATTRWTASSVVPRAAAADDAHEAPSALSCSLPSVRRPPAPRRQRWRCGLGAGDRRCELRCARPPCTAGSVARRGAALTAAKTSAARRRARRRSTQSAPQIQGHVYCCGDAIVSEVECLRGALLSRVPYC